MIFNDAFTYEVGSQALNSSATWKSGGLAAILDFYLLKGFLSIRRFDAYRHEYRR